MINEKLLEADEIFLLDIICDKVMENLEADEITIYNKVAEVFDVESIEKVDRILSLINLTKRVFLYT